MTANVLPKPKRSWFTRPAPYTIIILIMTLALGIPLFSIETSRFAVSSDLSVISFFMIGAYSLISLYYAARERPFTMNCAHWVFILFFFFYAPFVQFLVNHPPRQTNIGAFQKYHLQTNLLILIWCVLYTITYKMSYKKASKVQVPEQEQPAPVAPNYFGLIAISTVALLFIAAALGSGGFISRAVAATVLKKDEAKTTYLIANTFCRAIPVMAFAQVILSWRSRRPGAMAAAIILGIAALSVNHFLAVPRFWFGTIAIGVICTFIRSRRVTAIWLPALLCFAFIYIMPFLNVTRNADVSKVGLRSYVVYDVTSVLVAADFDAYSMYANTEKYVHDVDVTYGNQVLASVFFFVPRAIWKDKPGGSSALIAKRYNTINKNLSEPLPAEGYIDFGILGSFLYAIGFAFVLARFDSVYWNNRSTANANAPTLINLVYPFLIGMVIFIMRGSLNSSFAYACGLVAAGWCTQKVGFVGRKQTITRTFAPRRRVVAPVASEAS